MELLCIVFFISLLVEATTNIVTKSQLFLPIRKFLFKKCKLLHDLIDCPYCTSVWVSLFYMCLLYLFFMYLFVSPLIMVLLVLVVHRMSNIIHFLIDRLDGSNRFE
jgi:hypothetical protein